MIKTDNPIADAEAWASRKFYFEGVKLLDLLPITLMEHYHYLSRTWRLAMIMSRLHGGIGI